VSPKLKYRISNTLRVFFLEAWEFWVTIIVLVILSVIPKIWAPSNPETIARHSGILLQLAGLITVAIGIHQTRHRFGRPTYRAGIKRWLADLKNAALLPPITGSGHVTGDLRAHASGSATVSATLTRATSTLEERLEDLEGVVDDLKKRLSESIRDNSQAMQAIREALAGEKADRERSNADLRSLLEEQSAGGLHLELMGLVWLLFGTLMGW
jgi:hypothetical protein